MSEPTAEKQTTGKVPPDDGWEEQVAVTGRPLDEAPPNSTFAERAKVRDQRGAPADVTAVAQATATAPRATRRPKKG